MNTSRQQNEKNGSNENGVGGWKFNLGKVYMFVERKIWRTIVIFTAMVVHASHLSLSLDQIAATSEMEETRTLPLLERRGNSFISAFHFLPLNRHNQRLTVRVFSPFLKWETPKGLPIGSLWWFFLFFILVLLVNGLHASRNGNEAGRTSCAMSRVSRLKNLAPPPPRVMYGYPVPLRSYFFFTYDKNMF